MNYKYFMEKALEQAEKALNKGEFPVGCVLACGNDVLATGSRTGTKDNINEIDHAEIIALKRFSEFDENIDKSGVALYTTLEPCLMCFGAIILSGVREVVYAYEDVMGGGTGCDLKFLSPLYSERPVSVVPNILREKSLDLFRKFFKNPENRYWRGSLLAKYTLSQ